MLRKQIQGLVPKWGYRFKQTNRELVQKPILATLKQPPSVMAPRPYDGNWQFKMESPIDPARLQEGCIRPGATLPTVSRPCML